ncbi:hypothetical protein [Psychromonas sp. MME2]
MKKSPLLLLFISVISFSSFFANAKDKNMVGKTGDVPCPCVFNKNRAWNPDKIVWNNQEWFCSKYNEDGLCDSVAVINYTDKKPNECDNDTVPLRCLFDLKKAPKAIKINGSTWACLAYDINNKCIQVHEVE